MISSTARSRGSITLSKLVSWFITESSVQPNRTLFAPAFSNSLIWLFNNSCLCWVPDITEWIIRLVSRCPRLSSVTTLSCSNRDLCNCERIVLGEASSPTLRTPLFTKARSVSSISESGLIGRILVKSASNRWAVLQAITIWVKSWLPKTIKMLLDDV